ncbi:hypothetical protein [Aliidiomarina quisquiliarum]|uniref:hypothetical protein n=1 Tax=Aliidiomarina quisquiliarum TaxID=2938947 RepID=UPI00208EC976|nr:hypothetical protein [Aliidiomarina quisquiliarum]MCO4319979.1 hypothetical protein [Aliidiomarina quisquiliarum]
MNKESIISLAEAIAMPCYRLSQLSQAITLRSVMEKLCIASLEVNAEESFDDNSYYTDYRFGSGVFIDEPGVEKAGGVTAIVDVIESMFNIEVNLTSDNPEGLDDFFSTWEFLEVLDELVSAEDIYLFNQRESDVQLAQITRDIDECIARDIPALENAFAELKVV